MGNTESDGDVAITSATKSATTTRDTAKQLREEATRNLVQFACTTIVASPFRHFSLPHAISHYPQTHLIGSRSAESVPESVQTPDTSDLEIINITPATLDITRAKPNVQLTMAEYHLKRKVTARSDERKQVEI